MALHIGTSGWSYNHWEGVLYPLHTPVHARLRFYGACFPTVEINATFYRWPKPATFESWQKRLPPGFLMSVKAPRFIHNKRLLKPESSLERVVNDLWHLGDKFGVLLVPSSRSSAMTMRDWITSWPKCLRGSGLRSNSRHPSWHREEVFQLLERRGAAYCIMSGSRLPCILRATAPFVYVRLHGPDQQHLYGGSYFRMTICAGGRIAYGNGRCNNGMFSCTSIMTAGAMRCATPAQCARSWACNTRDNERFRDGALAQPANRSSF